MHSVLWIVVLLLLLLWVFGAHNCLWWHILYSDSNSLYCMIAFGVVAGYLAVWVWHCWYCSSEFCNACMHTNTCLHMYNVHACKFCGGCDTCKNWNSNVYKSTYEQKYTYTQTNSSVLCEVAICVQLRHLMVTHEK